MSLTQDDRRLLTRATELALEWHAEHFRKGTTTPYVSHLLQVEGLVIEHGGGVDQAVAALLHDGLEDADTPQERCCVRHEGKALQLQDLGSGGNWHIFLRDFFSELDDSSTWAAGSDIVGSLLAMIHADRV